ncbi:hypothetical protein P3T43_006612 [Paraburkholderia sp. GAS41]|uniref:AAA family ATPase n=1 Tax=Paraburkholderia sp. GAS41 TaxID=3035134 RepID=UPI003D21A7B6
MKRPRVAGLNSNRVARLSDAAIQCRISTAIHKRDRPLKYKNENRTYVLAYGSSRLLATPKHRPKPGFVQAKIDNLFDPFLPVGDAEAWLASVSDEVFDDAAMTLRSLMPVGDDVRLLRPEGQDTRVLASVGGSDFRTFAQLSDGYQSLLGIAADIMEMMHRAGYQSMQSAQGIVLIDELGNHFHPAWRMQIVTALRSAFPSVQFIFSTHEPLCLRGLEQNEVAALRRDVHSRVYALVDLPDVSQLRVDQLLASEHFGLESTVDPDLDVAMRRYQALVVKPFRTEDEGRELERLRSELTGSALLGLNRRERMLLELLAFDEANFPAPEIPSVSADVLSQNSVNRIKEIMTIVSGPRDTPRGDADSQRRN